MRFLSLRKTLLNGGEPFSVANEVYSFTQKKIQQGVDDETSWNNLFQNWSKTYPELRRKWNLFHSKKLPSLQLPKFPPLESVPSRKSSSQVLNHLSSQIPNLYGGSADLDCSNLSRINDADDINTDKFNGRNLHFGVREHAMGAYL